MGHLNAAYAITRQILAGSIPVSKTMSRPWPQAVTQA